MDEIVKDVEKQLAEKMKFREAMLKVIRETNENRDAILANMDEDELRERLRAMKKGAIENIEKLKKTAIENFKKNGVRVLEAKDAEDARDIILGIIGREKLVVKSKSNACKEIELNRFLEECGVEVVETDLGDFLTQVCGVEGIHPVIPAMHLTPEEMAGALRKKFGAKVSAKPAQFSRSENAPHFAEGKIAEEIVGFARGYLREKITRSKIGITGANALTSDGNIVVLENEGNISLVSRYPDKHIAVAGFEKIVPTLEDALLVARCDAIWGTGREAPVYISIINGPSKTADIENKAVLGAQGAKEVYLVLIDNGRSEMIEGGLGELMYCINCGACDNACPSYHQLAEFFGFERAGGKGLISHVIADERDENNLRAYLCLACSGCKEDCPAKIDIPLLIKKLRARMAKNGFELETNRQMVENVRKYGNPFGEIEEGEIPKNLYCC
ncbi:MAG: LUD domain-containing protein [Candidatus Micrarchaeota archaeon]